MKQKINRRQFLSSSLLKTGTGFFVLGSGRFARILSAAERGPGGSLCVIDPAKTHYQMAPTWTLTYFAGQGGLAVDQSIMVRCPSAIVPEHKLTVTSSDPGFNFSVVVKENIGIPRVIWIQPYQAFLPEGESLTITLSDYKPPITTARCTFNIYEVDPWGSNPEIGSGLTFQEVPTMGGECLPGETARFNVVLPARAQVNEPIRLKIAALDAHSMATSRFMGNLVLRSDLPFLGLPDTVTFAHEDMGSLVIEVVPAAPGIARIEATDGVSASESNPCVCTMEPVEDHIFFGDYHKHSFHCDGLLEPAEIYDYAKRSAFLDWGALASHDMLPAPERGAHNWADLHAKTEAAHVPGEFISFQGYEWSHNTPFSPFDARGHKVILFLDPGHLLPIIPYTYKERPAGHHECIPATTLMDLLFKRAGRDVLVIPHHLPLYKWWVFPEVLDTEMGGALPEMTREQIDAMQPVAEAFSRVHGNNESWDLQEWIKPPTSFGAKIRHTFWQDGLMEGVKAGAVCAGDNHTLPLGHPGGTGLTAVMASELSREGIFRAIQNRRTYGTSGPRVFIDFRIRCNGRGGEKLKMGDAAPLPEESPVIEAVVVSPLPIDYIEVVKVRPGVAEVPFTFQVHGDRECSFQWEEHSPSAPPWVCYYLRIHLDSDSEGAWTSPIWLGK